jgi:thiosulfate dehydrogenase (quinone) large subunit
MRNERIIADPPLARFLFDSPASSWIWLLARVYLGWQWLNAGTHKVTDPAWMSTGAALQGFLTRAVAIPAPPAKPPITYGWYRTFLVGILEGGNYVWFAKLVAVGEVLIGAALILGLLTGFAAFFGALMNFSFLLAGTTSTNPVLFAIAILLILAWKVAGYWGVDRFLLPLVGTPWRGAPPEQPTPRPDSRYRPEEKPDDGPRTRV